MSRLGRIGRIFAEGHPNRVTIEQADAVVEAAAALADGWNSGAENEFVELGDAMMAAVADYRGEPGAEARE
jgi:hypothetical protein